MKKSMYNFLISSSDGKKLLYNPVSGGFASLDDSAFSKYEHVEEISNVQNFTEDADLSELKRGKMVVDDNVDEVMYLEALHRLVRYRQRSLGLTIAPTIDCNFRCVYCYETTKNAYMNEETESQVIEFVQERLKTIESFSVTWYGGEPLLAQETIDRLSRKFIEMCEENNVSYSAGMISNGYLLDKKVAKWMKDLCINHVQITLDGPRDVHNSMRPLYDGGETFDVILKNVKQILDFLTVNIRVSVDRSNVNRVGEVVPVLQKEGLLPKVAFGYSAIVDIGDVCQAAKANCFDWIDFSKASLKLYQDTLKNGHYVVPYPRSKVRICVGSSASGFVLDPSGALHKCWATVGNEGEYIGHVSKPLDITPNLVKWLTWDPFKDDNCRTCNVFPLCWGHCPYRWFINQRACTEWKIVLEDMLKLFYRAKKAKGEID